MDRTLFQYHTKSTTKEEVITNQTCLPSIFQEKFRIKERNFMMKFMMGQCLQLACLILRLYISIIEMSDIKQLLLSKNKHNTINENVQLF